MFFFKLSNNTQTIPARTLDVSVVGQGECHFNFLLSVTCYARSHLDADFDLKR